MGILFQSWSLDVVPPVLMMVVLFLLCAALHCTGLHKLHCHLFSWVWGLLEEQVSVWCLVGL